MSGRSFVMAMGTTVSESPGKAWRSYCSSLRKNPLFTKAATSVVGFAMGDCLAQLTTRPPIDAAQRRRWRYDYQRTARMAAFGGLFAGPVGHYWFRMLDSRIMTANPTAPAAVMLKAGIDQAFMAPFGTAAFYVFSKTVEGKREEIVPVLKEKFVPTMICSYKLWPAAHIINFSFIPASQRVLYTNIVSIAWTYILSRVSADAGEAGDAVATDKLGEEEQAGNYMGIL